jgi:DNA-binding XRE family transcriptional regulator
VADDAYRPVRHEHDAFLARAMKRKGFAAAYAESAGDYALVHELIGARAAAGLTQAQVAASMGTTKSAISRLEGFAGPSPSVSTLRRYAAAVGCEVEIRLVPRQPVELAESASDASGDAGTALSA